MAPGWIQTSLGWPSRGAWHFVCLRQWDLAGGGGKRGEGVQRAESACLKVQTETLPGGPVVKNPLANAGDTDLSLVWEDPTCCGQLSPSAPATELERHKY